MEMKHLEQHLLRNHFKNLVAEKTEKCSQLEKEKNKEMDCEYDNTPSRRRKSSVRERKESR